MQEAGLIDHWIAHNGIDSSYCLRKIDQETNGKKKEGELKRLSLNALSGAFIVLGVGTSLAIAAFIVKVVHGYFDKKRMMMARRHRAQVMAAENKRKNDQIAKPVVAATENLVVVELD